MREKDGSDREEEEEREAIEGRSGAPSRGVGGGGRERSPAESPAPECKVQHRLR